MILFAMCPTTIVASVIPSAIDLVDDMPQDRLAGNVQENLREREGVRTEPRTRFRQRVIMACIRCVAVLITNRKKLYGTPYQRSKNRAFWPISTGLIL